MVVPDFLYGEPYAPDNTERPLPVWLKDHGTVGSVLDPTRIILDFRIGKALDFFLAFDYPRLHVIVK